MKLIIDLIVGILWLLIRIGDTVIIAGEFVVKNAKKTFKKVRKIKTRPPSAPRSTFRGIELKLSLPSFKLPEFKLKLNLPKIKKRIKVEKPKNINIFPGPIPHLIKFKYFVFGAFFSFILIYIPLLFLIFLQNLPNPKLLSLRDVAQTTKIYDRNGILLYQIYANENRTVIPLSDIPKNLVNATIATEDKDFYTNPGFNIDSIIRAAIQNLQGKPLQGGSTITQQLIKSTLLTPEQTWSRKIKELILAFWAEKIYSKNEILTMYFNQVSYGGTAWGVEAAAQTYFGKDVKDLDLSQSAFLAGLTKAPTTYSPFGDDPNLWKGRQKDVLERMKSLGYISSDDENNALNENLNFLPPQSPIHAPHFVFFVKDWLVQKYGLPLVEKGGLNVTTSLDLKLNEKVQNIVKNEVDKDGQYNLSNGAALVTNPKNGDILAMVGSKDFEDPNFGRVNITTSLRQPGSSVKPITYSAALMNRFTAATILNDSPVSFGDPGAIRYSPVNYDGRFHGNVSLRIALANSINVPAVKTLYSIGINKMLSLAQEMGITTWDSPQKYGLAVTLGAAEVKMTDMATVYGTLANLGDRVDLDPLLKVSDAQGNVLYEKTNPEKTPILDSGIAYIISNILSDNGARSMEFGTNSPLNIAGVSVKTGTSDQLRDNWTIGYIPNYVVAVWVGNNNNQPMSGIASGITGAAPIWHAIFSELLGNKSPQTVAVPADVLQKDCIGRKELFIRGTENSVNCNPPSPSPSPTPVEQAKSQ